MPKEYILQTTPITARLPYEGVALFDDFSPTLLWEATTYNAGEQVELVTYPHFSGHYALKIRNKDVDGQANVMYARRSIPLLHAPRVTLNVLFCFLTGSAITRLTFAIDATFDGIAQGAGAFYDNENHKWVIVKAGPVEQDVTDSDMYLTLDKWHHMSITIDLETHKFVTLRSENKLFDLTDYSFDTSADPNITQLHVQLGLKGDTNEQVKAFFDTVLVTQL